MTLAALSIRCSTSQKNPDSESEYPLLETMGYYQRFSQKLWMAGENKNWELAEFYAHEIHEVTEELIKSEVMHDDQNLSELAKSLFENKVVELGEIIDKKDQVLFRKHYNIVVESCNQCHTATRHPFIKITIPNDSTIFNQKF